MRASLEDSVLRPAQRTVHSGTAIEPHPAPGDCTRTRPTSCAPSVRVPRVLLHPCPLSLARAPSRAVPGTGARYESVHVDPQRPGNGERGTGNGDGALIDGARVHSYHSASASLSPSALPVSVPAVCTLLALALARAPSSSPSPSPVCALCYALRSILSSVLRVLRVLRIRILVFSSLARVGAVI